MRSNSWSTEVFAGFPFAVMALLALPAVLQQETQQGEAPAAAQNQENIVGDEACRACHSQETSGYLGTAHHFTSQAPTKNAILGSFIEDKNLLKTSDQALFF